MTDVEWAGGWPATQVLPFRFLALLLVIGFGAAALLIALAGVMKRPGARALWRYWVLQLSVVLVILIPVLAGRGPWLLFSALLGAVTFVELKRTLGSKRSLGAGNPRSGPVRHLLLFYPVLGAGALGWTGIAGGPGAVIWLFFVTELTDSFALLVGKSVGRRHPFPGLSPGKTLEGMIGGMAAGVGAGMVAAPLLPGLSTAQAAALAVTFALLTQMGDLFASWIKRRAGVKDFGSYLPLHGSVLDVYDALLFTAVPFLAFLLWFLS